MIKRLSLFFLIALLPFAATTLAQAGALPLELAYDHPELWEQDIPVAVAPDGSRVAYVIRHVPPDVDVAAGARWQENGAPMSAIGTKVYISSTGSGEMSQVCDNGGYSWRPSWSPDSKTLALYSDAGGTVGLWTYEVSTGQCRQASDAVIKAKLWVGDEAQWSPDGATVYVPLIPEGKTPGYERVGEIEARAKTKSTDLVLYTSGSEVPPVKEGDEEAEDPALGGEHFVRENNAAVGAVDLASGVSRVLVPAGAEPRPSVIRVSASGRWVSFLSIWQRTSVTDDASMTMSLGVVPSNGGPVKIVADGLPNTERDYHRLTYSWHPSEDRLVYLKDGALFLVDFDADGPMAPKQLGPELGELTLGVHWFTRDGRAVVAGTGADRVRASALSDAPPTGLVVIPLDGATAQRVRFDFDTWSYASLVKADARTVWQPDGRSLTVLLRDVKTGEVAVVRYSLADGSSRELWRGRARIRGLAAAADGEALYGAYQDVATPLDVYRFSSNFSRTSRLSRITPGFDDITPPEVRIFTTRVPMHDHSLLEVRTAVLLPADLQPGETPPGIVTFYPDSDASTQVDTFGGGNRAGVPALVFTSRGYAVLYPHVKTGPGGEPGNIIDEMIDSLMPQIYRAAEKGFVDPTRLALHGNSFGGYGTAAIVTQTNLFRAAVPTNGIYDLVGYTYSGAPAGSIAWTEDRQPRVGDHLWAAPLRYIRASPLYAVDKIKTPLLIMQGGDDGLRPQSETLFTALKRLDRPAQLAIYEGAGHWIAAWPRAQAIAGTQRILEFFEKHLSKP